MSLEGQEFSESRWYTLRTVLLRKMFSRLTRDSPPLFLKGDDIITASPMTIAAHERPVTRLLHALAAAGYDDALFDIGANVGLTSYFSHDRFRRLYCFEPNPRVFHALAANLEPLASSDRSVALFDFGIGDRTAEHMLMVPRRNYGGAFVNGSGNMLTQAELAVKEGHARYDESQFLRIPVSIRRGRDVLPPLFAQLPPGAGIVVKIDVEGFESTVLTELAASLPRGLRVAIVFENWSDSFDPVAFFAQTFAGRTGQVLKLASSLDEPSRQRRNVTLLIRGDRHRLIAKPLHWRGEVVYLIDP